MILKSNFGWFAAADKIPLPSSSTVKKLTAVITLTTFLVTGGIQDMAGFDLQKLFANPTPLVNFGSLSEARNPAGPVQSFQTDLFTGRAQTSVPIFMPPGRRGLTPQVALNYSSSGGNSLLGVGWSIATAGIERSTKKGVPTYNDVQDTFVLSMQSVNSDLVRISPTEYHVKDESGEFLKIIYDSGYWKVWDKSGTEYTFGQNPEARQSNPRGIFSWNLEKVKDVHGNTIFYTYTQDA